jgi:ubiquinone/menaquinone biosynthesis C-methylase UbiE
MRFRETGLGRMIHQLPGGEHALAFGRRLVTPYWHLRTLKAKRERMLTLKRNARDAYSKTGIKYTPASGLWPLYVDLPPDMWFMAKYPDGEKMQIHLTYERGYEDIDGMAHLPLYRQFVSHLRGRFGPHPEKDGRILDCACGSGYGSNYIQDELQCKVVGIDLDPQAVRYATKRYASNHPALSYRQADATSLDSLDSHSFLGVVSIETIEHIPDDAKVVAEFHRILQPGGILFMSTPDATLRPGTLTSEFHVREYSREEFEALLRAFETVDIVEQKPYLLATCQA